MKSFAVLAVLAFAAFASATDYCDSKICQIPGLPPTTDKHVACGFDGKANKRCTGYIELTAAQKNIILDTHNKLRNKFASGQQPGFPTASRMPTLKWHDELTYIATVNAFNCDFEHDACRNTDDFQFAGQNLAQRGESDKYPEVNGALKDSIEGWYAEVENATVNDVQPLYTGATPYTIGHFTQVINAFADYVGCAAVNYKYMWGSTQMNGFQLTCDYSRTNVGNQALYTAGPTASECTTGTNPKYPALCSEKEQIDANVLKF